MKLGDKIKKLRELRGLSQRDLATIAGVTAGGLGDIEIGKIKNPGVHTVEKIANALGVSVVYFLEREATKTPFDMEALGLILTDEMAEFVGSSKFMPYLVLSKEAADKGVSPEALKAILSAIRQTMGEFA